MKQASLLQPQRAQTGARWVLGSALDRFRTSGLIRYARSSFIGGTLKLHGLIPLLAPALIQASARAQSPEEARAEPFQLGGYVEAVYQWNFNQPSNNITNYRGFDNRHNTFTLSNVALDARWDYANVLGRATLQVGHTPSSYYMAEPSAPGASGANATGTELWKYIQQAYAGYRFHIERELQVAAGVFLSPIGPESMAVYDSWNWSRSNLFVGLPFYHAGVRATYSLADPWSVTLAVYNGWNSVVDNNNEKSFTAKLAYADPTVALSVLYFGGVERAPGALEGRAFRHSFDAHVTWHMTSYLATIAHINIGFEPNRFGLSHWQAAALLARFQLATSWFIAARADAFFEHAAASGTGRAQAIFWPVDWVSSGTLTIDYRPHERASFRIEYRHDHAAGAMFFGRRLSMNEPFVPTRRSQDTVSMGVTTWF